MSASSGGSTTIGLLFTTIVTLAGLVLFVVLWAATVRAYLNRQILRRQMGAILAFIAAALLTPLVILWVLYLRS